jgi:hypothetical protein
MQNFACLQRTVKFQTCFAYCAVSIYCQMTASIDFIGNGGRMQASKADKRTPASDNQQLVESTTESAGTDSWIWTAMTYYVM